MLLDRLTTLPQYLAPQHSLTWLMGKLANIENPRIKNKAIRRFIKAYGVDMSESAIESIEDFKSFNDFFTRRLKEGSRPLVSGEHDIACPVDGSVSQVGDILGGQIFQAKGRSYSVYELLGGNVSHSEPFLNGRFATIYLAPKDYHRVHMPFTGTLSEMIYLPGKLFSVSHTTARVVPKLFARNERAVCLFETEFGPMAVVMVGAMIVAGMNTVWHGDITPPRQSQLRHIKYPNPKSDAITLNRGDEMGYFNLGSTVIVLFPEDSMQFDEAITPGASVRMGQLLGNVNGTD